MIPTKTLLGKVLLVSAVVLAPRLGCDGVGRVGLAFRPQVGRLLATFYVFAVVDRHDDVVARLI